jgi:hypothetical protein
LSAFTMNRNRGPFSAQTMCGLCNSLSSKHSCPFLTPFSPSAPDGCRNGLHIVFGESLFAIKIKRCFFRPHTTQILFGPVFLGVVFSQIQGSFSIAIFYFQFQLVGNSFVEFVNEQECSEFISGKTTLYHGF